MAAGGRSWGDGTVLKRPWGWLHGATRGIQLHGATDTQMGAYRTHE